MSENKKKSGKRKKSAKSQKDPNSVSAGKSPAVTDDELDESDVLHAEKEAEAFTRMEWNASQLDKLGLYHKGRYETLQRESVKKWEKRICEYAFYAICVIFFYPLFDALGRYVIKEIDLEYGPEAFNFTSQHYFYLYLLGKISLILIPSTLLVWAISSLKRVRLLMAVHKDKQILCETCVIAIQSSKLREVQVDAMRAAFPEIFSSTYTQIGGKGSHESLTRDEVFKLIELVKTKD